MYRLQRDFVKRAMPAWFSSTANGIRGLQLPFRTPENKMYCIMCNPGEVTVPHRYAATIHERGFAGAIAILAE